MFYKNYGWKAPAHSDPHTAALRGEEYPNEIWFLLDKTTNDGNKLRVIIILRATL